MLSNLKKNGIKKIFSSWDTGNFEIKFWDNESFKVGKNYPDFNIIFKTEPTTKDLKKDMSIFIGEGYMDGKIDIKGNLDFAIKTLYLKNNEKFLNKQKSISKVAKDEEKQNIASHYDIGNDFYELWLDETLSYSCAYFKNQNDSLYEAQINKIDHTLAKLKLKPNERLLDIGCGWGWLCVRAVQKYGVNAVGITISEEQHKKAKQRAKELGIEDKLDFRLLNYQELSPDKLGLFDKAVSVGMFEHVGYGNADIYLQIVKSMLKPNSIFLLHSIMCKFPGETNKWIKKYIFPGGYIPTISGLIHIANESGFDLELAESLRLHYAKTLEHWYANFEKNLDKIEKNYDQRFIKMWSLYLRGCASAFRVGSVDIYQLTLENLG